MHVSLQAAFSVAQVWNDIKILTSRPVQIVAGSEGERKENSKSVSKFLSLEFFFTHPDSSFCSRPRGLAEPPPDMGVGILGAAPPPPPRRGLAIRPKFRGDDAAF